ncbi:MAG: hypothetical protein LBL55_00480, partial [Propionibacteriaceae bacterium]|nr:hypothetical protein [Propionibacteriaceae bacterium]
QTDSGLAQTESSQYSRRIGLTGACDPAPLDPQTTVEVNSARFGGPNRGGFASCDTGRVLADGVTPECTLRAAIELSNAIGRFTAVTVQLAQGFAGGVIPTAKTTSDWMLVSSKITNFARAYKATGAYWHITAPVTIDLGNVLQTSNFDNGPAAAFYVEASDVVLNNFSQIMSGASSIVVAGTARNVVVAGGSTIQTANYNTDHFLVIENGAQNVTFRDYSVGGLRGTTPEPGSGGVAFDGFTKTAASNITIQNVTFRSPKTGTACSTTDGSGCVNTGVSLGHSNYATVIDNLTIRDCRFLDIGSSNHVLHAVHGYYAGTLSNIKILDNEFRNVFSSAESYWYRGLIQLPNGRAMSGANQISGNTFDNSAIVGSKQSYAISWKSSHTTTASASTASNLVIEKNYFDGFARAGVYLADTGLTTVRGNTFGPHHVSQTGGQTAATETQAATYSSDEESSTSGVMVANTNSRANQQIRTWYPSGKPLADRVDGACAATVRAVPSTGSSAPKTPVTIDVYWTPGQQAEVHLGSYGPFSAAADLDVPVPDQAIDPVSGAVTGFIRFQTQTDGGAQTESSQYSRRIALAGVCELPKVGEGALEVRLQGWTGVQGEATYDNIVATGRLIANGASLPVGSRVWWTYEVVNQGSTDLTDVVVTDSVRGEVCRLAALASGQRAGCAAEGDLALPGGPTG